MLADVTPTDYLGWGGRDVAGYIGTATGRNLNSPGSQAMNSPSVHNFCVRTDAHGSRCSGSGTE